MKHKEIAIYGAGTRGGELFNLLITLNLSEYVVAFCDKEYNAKIFPSTNLHIYPYEQLKNKNLIFLVSPINNQEITAQLIIDHQEYYISIDEFLLKYYSNDPEKTNYISKELFELNDNNILLNKYYNMPNYKEVIYNSNSNICYIFFSGNGLYHPNEKGAFLKKIKGTDKYEWENFVSTSSIPQIASKCIYVRDIRKSWYVTGINSSINNIDKLLTLLQSITKGYEVITVGNSAGGYMASLVGLKLNAKMAFNFSGQFSLWETYSITTEYFLVNNKHIPSINKYFNVLQYAPNSTCTIIYLFPAFSPSDIKQSSYLNNEKNILTFRINEHSHGKTLTNKDIAHLLTLNLADIKQLHEKYKDILIQPNEFEFIK